MEEKNNKKSDYNYSPKLTPKCCIDCDYYKNCNGCYDGMEFTNKNIEKIFDIVEEKIERGHTKSAWEIKEMYEKGLLK